jgi:hypothetical protein
MSAGSSMANSHTRSFLKFFIPDYRPHMRNGVIVPMRA